MGDEGSSDTEFFDFPSIGAGWISVKLQHKLALHEAVVGLLLDL